jgi:hypothetical protein
VSANRVRFSPAKPVLGLAADLADGAALRDARSEMLSLAATWRVQADAGCEVSLYDLSME